MNNPISSPLVSIFMPVYNGGAFLRRSIDSILNQTYQNWELLCVDDSSLDDSYSILTEYSKKDSRIRVFSKPNGGNVPKSFNFVHPHMRGEYYMYLSQDDYMSQDNVESCYENLIRENADMAMPICRIIYKDKKQNYNIELSQNSISGKEAFYQSLTWKVHGFCLYKMSLLDGIILDENIYNSDEYLTRLSFLKSFKVAKCNSYFYYCCDNDNAITELWKPYRLQYLLCDNLILKLFKEYNLDDSIKSFFIAKNIAERYILLKKIDKTKSWNVCDKLFAYDLFDKSFDFFSLGMIFKTKRIRTIVKYLLINFQMFFTKWTRKTILSKG